MSKNKKIICKSGLTGWQMKLQKSYNDINEFSVFCGLYNIHKRLGFKTIKSAWETNPMIQGSILPTDLCVVK